MSLTKIKILQNKIYIRKSDEEKEFIYYVLRIVYILFIFGTLSRTQIKISKYKKKILIEECIIIKKFLNNKKKLYLQIFALFIKKK